MSLVHCLGWYVDSNREQRKFCHYTNRNTNNTDLCVFVSLNVLMFSKHWMNPFLCKISLSVYPTAWKSVIWIQFYFSFMSNRTIFSMHLYQTSLFFNLFLKIECFNATMSFVQNMTFLILSVWNKRIFYFNLLCYFLKTISLETLELTPSVTKEDFVDQNKIKFYKLHLNSIIKPSSQEHIWEKVMNFFYWWAVH